MSDERITSTLELEERIRLYLNAAGISFEETEGAAASVTIGSNQVMMFAVQLEPVTFLLRFVSSLSRGVDPSAELYEYVSRSNSEIVFGRLSVTDSAELPGKADVWFDHVIFGDDFDPAELIKTLNLFAREGDFRDDDVIEKFGGN